MCSLRGKIHSQRTKLFRYLHPGNMPPMHYGVYAKRSSRLESSMKLPTVFITNELVRFYWLPEHSEQYRRELLEI